MIIQLEHNGKIIHREGVCPDVKPSVLPVACKCSITKPGVQKLMEIHLRRDCDNNLLYSFDP